MHICCEFYNITHKNIKRVKFSANATSAKLEEYCQEFMSVLRKSCSTFLSLNETF